MTEQAAYEYAAIAFAAALVIWAPRWARSVGARGLRLLGNLARRPVLVCVTLAVATGITAMLCAYFVHWPQPSVHDEYAYLLGAETFAGGELTRPRHEMWTHFETMHVMHLPTYSSKYPPGQSLSLALGLVLAGEARVGLWLQAAMLVGAMTWMLFQWLPRRWALLGGILIAMQLGVRGPWVQTFYGGSLAGAGGALMLGAVPGILSRRSLGSALALGVGLAMLSVTRPYEGLVASLPVAVVLLASWIRDGRQGLPSFTLRVAAPVFSIIGVAVLAIAVHNFAVTGDAALLPYAAYDQQYSIYPAFLMQDVGVEPSYRHEALAEFMRRFQRGVHGQVPGPISWVKFALARDVRLVSGLFGQVLAAAFFAGLIVLGLRRFRTGFPMKRTKSLALPIAVGVLFALASTITTYGQPHYSAPMLGALMVLFMAGLRRIAAAPAAGRARGGAVLIGILMAMAVTTAERASKKWLGGPRYGGHVRAKLVKRLQESPGPDLVLVNAPNFESVHQELVYNAADIDASEIVWARDMTDEENAEIMGYYPGRTVWRLRVDSVLSERFEFETVRPGDPGQAAALSGPAWGPW